MPQDTIEALNLVRIRPDSYENFGILVAEKWCKDPSTLPTTLDDFKNQVGGMLMMPLPDWVKAVQFVQMNDETLLIRLPNKKLIEKASAFFASADPTMTYPLPDFYGVAAGGGGQIPPLSLFHSRIGDYTIAQCGG